MAVSTKYDRRSHSWVDLKEDSVPVGSVPVGSVPVGSKPDDATAKDTNPNKNSKALTSAGNRSGKEGDTSISRKVVYTEAEIVMLPDTDNALTRKAGTSIMCKNLGNFSSKYYLSEVKHVISRSGYSLTGSAIKIASNANELNKEKVQPVDSKGNTKVDVPVAKKSYTVIAGDSLYKIAGKSEVYGNTSRWKLLWEANKEMLIKKDARNITSPGSYISIGQVLIVP